MPSLLGKLKLAAMYLDGRLEGYPWRGGIGQGSRVYFVDAPLALTVSSVFLWQSWGEGLPMAISSSLVTLSLAASLKGLWELLQLPPGKDVEGVERMLGAMEKGIKENMEGNRELVGVERALEQWEVRGRKGSYESEHVLSIQGGEGEVVAIPYLFTGKEVIVLTIQGMAGRKRAVRRVMRRLKGGLLNRMAERHSVFMLRPSFNHYLSEPHAGLLPWGAYRNLFDEGKEREVWLVGFISREGLLEKAEGVVEDMEQVGKAVEGAAGKLGRLFFENKRALGRVVTSLKGGKRYGALRVKIAPLRWKNG